jgi:hypothetical protein
MINQTYFVASEFRASHKKVQPVLQRSKKFLYSNLNGWEMAVHILVSGAKYPALSISNLFLALARESILMTRKPTIAYTILGPSILRDQWLAPCKIITTSTDINNAEPTEGRREAMDIEQDPCKLN